MAGDGGARVERPGPVSVCRSCAARITWKETATGRMIPLDPTPVDVNTKGALVVIGGRALGRDAALAAVSERDAVSFVRAAEIIDARYDWHLSHFASCPAADHHRKGTR